MAVQILTKQLWKPGDGVIYKSYGTNFRAVVLSRYSDHPQTHEPRYIIGVLSLPSVQRSNIQDDNMASIRSVLFRAISGEMPEDMIPVARKAIRRQFDDWAFHRIYDQESFVGGFVLPKGERCYYDVLRSKGYDMLEVDAPSAEAQSGRPITSLRRVLQHSLGHPVEKTRRYKIKKEKLQEIIN